MASNNISRLPSDVLIVVLCRLEVKFLLRCTCVCKTWHYIVKNSCAKPHLTYQKTSSNAKKYIFHQDFESCTLLTDIKPVIDGNKHSSLYYSPELFDECQLRIHGFCDGLLCISNDGISDLGYCVGDNIYLFNPICRKAKKLPELKITGDDDDGIVRKGGVSFGFFGNDYKVIVISCVDREYIVSVYSLSSNCWNIMHTNSYYEHKIEYRFHVFCIMEPTKFVDGIAYMIIDIMRTNLSYRTLNQILPLTVCFDLKNGTIQQFKCPKEFLQFRKQYTIEAYGETIAALGCDNNDSRCLTMWILIRDKSSSKAIWEKKHVIKLDPGFSIPVGFLCNDIYLVKTVFMSQGGEQTFFFLYDLESKKFTEYWSPDDYPDEYCKIDSNWVESLLLLNEDSVDPFVHKEMESSCSPMLLTLMHDAPYSTSRKRKR